MARDWDRTFSYWASPPSETERTKCENAERVIRNAISASPALSDRSIKVFAQGSYRNRTNVRADSDVDICVLCKDTFFCDLSFGTGLTRENLGITAATYDYETFRKDVHDALIAYLGASALIPGNKAFDIHANTYRVDADVVPCFEHRRYVGTPASWDIEYGTELKPRQGSRIKNFPEQNYENGVSKNEQTSKRFKAIVRILKNLKEDIPNLTVPIPSYLLECLAWNVPNELYGQDTLRDDLRSVLANLWSRTQDDAQCREWGEVNELKYLFRDSQPWTRAGVVTFIEAAWAHAEL